jgi:hypothetical protein
MSRIKLLLSLFLFLVATIAYSQEKKYAQSIPVDIGQTGVNKVLCMKNGNTMLFHFEPGKPIVVKVFDSLHKMIAGREHPCHLLDIAMLGEATFKGLYDINNEAVLFLEQERLSRYVLIMLRFNAKDGTLVEEKFAGESQTQGKRTKYYVMKNKDDDGYAIFFCTDIPQFKKCNLSITYYNNKHEIVKEVPLQVDRKQYDVIDVLGAEWQHEGTCITLDLKKEIPGESAHSGDGIDPQWVGAHSLVNPYQVEGYTNTHKGGDKPGPNGVVAYNHDLCIYFIPKDGANVKTKVVGVTRDVYPYYSNFAYNPFANALNLLVLSYREYNYQFGTDIQPSAIVSSLFFNLDEEAMSFNYKWIKNERANSFIKEQTGKVRSFEGLPVKMFTNENGLSTVVYRSFNRYKDLETFERSAVYDSYLGDLCITQFDDNGNEIWGTVLPNAQFFKSYRHYYFADELSHRWQDQAMFLDLPPQVYKRQFLSQDVYNWNKSFYIIYNDYNKNFNNSIKKPGDTVYEFANTNTCYYKLNRKKEITKGYLFGEPARNEFKCSFIEGADFDEQRGVYAALVQRKRGDDISLIMAWSHLE